MRNLILLFYCIALFVNCFCQTSTVSLDSAYAQKSDSLLNEFYMEWKSDTTFSAPIKSDSEVQKTIATLTKLVAREAVYSNAKYTLFPTEIKYGIVKNLDPPNLYGTMVWDEWPIWKFIRYDILPHITDTILNYRPIVHQRVLYLSNAYRTTINNFLRLKENEKIRYKSKEIKQKIEFLSTGSTRLDTTTFLRPSYRTQFLYVPDIDAGVNALWTYCPIYLLINAKLDYAYHIGVFKNDRVIATIYKKENGVWRVSGGSSCKFNDNEND